MTPLEPREGSEGRPPATGASHYEAGMAVRRRVLGDAYVDRSIAAADEFSQPMQDLTTEFCWGAIWTREGLDLRTRSILNIGMLTALNRSHELAAHIRGALNNGVTREEIREVLLQTAVYVGVPAALESFRVAQGALDEAERE
jgi:4-carboxymuconolactone decarboxylase